MEKSILFVAAALGLGSLFAQESEPLQQEAAPNPSFVASEPLQQTAPNPVFVSFDEKNFPGFYVGADFLYWRVQEDGLEYGITGFKADTFAPSASSTSVPQGKLYDLDFGWEPGFKVHAGYASKEWAWDTNLNWTWLYAKATGSATGPGTYGDTSLYTLWNPTRYTGNVASQISPEWKLHYNTVDWNLCRSFCVGRHFSVNPSVGVRGAWIDQHYDLTNTGIGSGPGYVLNVSNTGNFRGGGFFGGADLCWFFNKAFSVYGNTAFSILYGSLDSTVKVRRTDPVVNIYNQTVVDFTADTHSVKSGLEGAVGFRYETDLDCSRYHIAVDIQWEYVLWFAMNPFLFPLMGSTGNEVSIAVPYGYSGAYGRLNGNLGFMGLTVGGHFSF